MSTIDSADSVGSAVSATVGADGLGLIAYHISASWLKVAHCSNLACSAATRTIISPFSNGQFASITVGADGLGLISHRDPAAEDLKIAHCSNVACSAATFATLDSAGDVGGFTSITVGADGLGLISYEDFTTFDLKVAHCSNVALLGRHVADPRRRRRRVHLDRDGRRRARV